MPESPTQGFRFRRQLLAVPSRSQTQTGVLKRATDLSAPLGPSFTTPALIGQKKSSLCFQFFNLDRRLLTDIDDADAHRSRKNALPQVYKNLI